MPVSPIESGEFAPGEPSAWVRRWAPLLAEGGYIPGCDHGVPPDISWPNFLAYARRLAEMTGWV